MMILVGFGVVNFVGVFLMFVQLIWVMDGSFLQHLSLLVVIAMYGMVLVQEKYRRTAIIHTGVYVFVVMFMAYYACGHFPSPFIGAIHLSCNSKVPVKVRSISPLSQKDNVTQVVIVGNAKLLTA